MIHDNGIKEFGGKSEVRDEALLLSALGQPQQTVFGKYAYDSIYKMAAAYLFFFSKNHAFFDGNKRVGLKACYHFLLLNSKDVLLTNKEFYDLAYGCVVDEINLDGVAAVLEKNGLDS